MDFNSMVEKDVKDVFLQEFSQTAIYTPKQGSAKEVTIQFFEESLDQMDTTFFHAWCANDDMKGIAKNDMFEINKIRYGVIDSSPDEFDSGLNIFLQKV